MTSSTLLRTILRNIDPKEYVVVVVVVVVVV